METFRKVNDTTVEVTTSQPDRVVLIRLDPLIRQRTSLFARLAELDKKIADIKALGVSAQTEVIGG